MKRLSREAIEKIAATLRPGQREMIASFLDTEVYPTEEGRSAAQGYIEMISAPDYEAKAARAERKDSIKIKAARAEMECISKSLISA